MTETYWYEALGDKHYFIQAEERDDGLYFRYVTPLISQDDRGYYRVRSWMQVEDSMVESFHADHRERDKPSNWENARLEVA